MRTFDELVLPPHSKQGHNRSVQGVSARDVVKAYDDVETGLADVTSRDLSLVEADKETIEKIREFVEEETRKFINE